MEKLKSYAFANEFGVGAVKREDPAEIRIPFGEWPYGEKEIGGKTLHVTQSMTAEGAAVIAAAVSNEKPIPVYYGHPDVPEVAHKYPDKAAKGWIEKAVATANELILSVRWLDAVREGFKWFSPYWTGKVSLANGGAAVSVDELISVGLVNMPNIEAFRLYNEAKSTDNTNNGDKMERKLLCERLGIPETSTDEEVLAAMDNLRKLANESEQAQAALANEKSSADGAKEAFANERTARICELVDRAIEDHRILSSAAEMWRTKLAEDFEKNSVALANEKPLKTESKVEKREKKEEGRQAKCVRDEIVRLANEKVAKGYGWDDAFAAVATEHPELFTNEK